MSSTPQNRRDWVETLQGPLKLPERWHILPHEMLFVLVMGVVWFRVGWSAGFSQSSASLFFLYTLSLAGVIVWCQFHPSPYRWRVRLGASLLLSALTYFSLSTAVPLMHNPSGLETFIWHQDTALAQWDTAWLGDWPRRLMELTPAAWVTDVFMACYLFFFYYIIGGLLYYFVKDLNLFRAALVGFGTVYALGYVGYMLMPAIGPLEEMGARSGGWLTETGGAFITQRTNGVDVFPSIHMAASLFLLMFDFQYRRAHFWWVLAPTVGLWISTVYLRYHYGVDLLVGIGLALGCVWLTRWYVRSRLCAELEAECAAHSRKVHVQI